ncbi:hypothetical protein BC941DRAFT_427889 [Chlamydoabsidia padenii]|nr:hypothetical protein BC941DRAFT_427889 [Chlamydoabsidia padenii]
MIKVEEYSNFPVSPTRLFAWDTSTTDDASITTFQPLTKANLIEHTSAQIQLPTNSKHFVMDWYSTSLKDNNLTPPLSPSSVTTNSSLKHRERKTSATTTQNIAIDAYPLPFPYHNDCTFLPTVETGRTRFDSESTQSLYDSQPSSPTHSIYKRHQYTATRSQRSPSLANCFRRGSNTSSTLTQSTTIKTDLIIDTPPAKKQVINKKNQSFRKRLSILVEKSQANPSSCHLLDGSTCYGHNSKSDNNLNRLTSSLKPASPSSRHHRQTALTGYYKSRSTTALSTRNTIQGNKAANPWYQDERQIYRASPSDDYQKHLQNKSDHSQLTSRRQEGLFIRFARRIWPFKHI